MIVFDGAQAPIGARIAIEQKEQDEIGEVQHRHRPERSTPAEIDDCEPNQRRPDDVGEFGGGIENRGRQRPLVSRKPIAGRLGIGRERRRLGDTEEQPRGDDAADAARERRQCCRRRPQGGAEAADRHDPKAVQHQSDRDLQQCIRPEEDAEDQTHLRRIQAKLLLQLRGGDGQGDAVEIIDQDAGAEQHADPPAVVRDRKPGRVCGHRGAC